MFPGVAGRVVHGVNLFLLSSDTQASLEPVVAVAAAATAAAMRNSSRFFQCILALGGFPWARGSGCGKFDSGQ
jgi:hypothetical protein